MSRKQTYLFAFIFICTLPLANSKFIAGELRTISFMIAGAVESPVAIREIFAIHAQLRIDKFDYNTYDWVRDISMSDPIRTILPEVGLVRIIMRNATTVIFEKYNDIDFHSLHSLSGYGFADIIHELYDAFN